MNTRFNLKAAALTGLVTLGFGAIEASALQPVAGKCHTSFPVSKLAHPATPEFLEEMRVRSGSAEVRLEQPGKGYTKEYREDRLRVLVDENNIMRSYMCG